MELSYDLGQIKEKEEEIKKKYEEKAKSKEAFINHVESVLKPHWTTAGGVSAVKRLENYADNNYQDYLEIIKNTIDKFDYIIDMLKHIENA